MLMWLAFFVGVGQSTSIACILPVVCVLSIVYTKRYKNCFWLRPSRRITTTTNDDFDTLDDDDDDDVSNIFSSDP